MPSDKVTLAQAAGQIGVHVNTIKTWRRYGYLKSAELIIEHGVEVWHVDLEEAIQVAQSKRKNRVDSSVNSGVYPAGYPGNNSPIGETSNTPAPGSALLARPEQAMLELITQTQRPLLEMINNRDATIQELAAKVATLEERLQAAEAARVAAQQVKPAAPVENYTRPSDRP